MRNATLAPEVHDTVPVTATSRSFVATLFVRNDSTAHPNPKSHAKFNGGISYESFRYRSNRIHRFRHRPRAACGGGTRRPPPPLRHGPPHNPRRRRPGAPPQPPRPRQTAEPRGPSGPPPPT